MRDPSNRDRRVGTAPFSNRHDALEHLDPFFAAFDDLRIDLDGIAGAYIGDRLLFLLFFEQADNVHDNPRILSNPGPGGYPPLSPSSRRRARRRDSSRRQAAILAWSPESKTSGTSIPRNRAGRV